MGTWDYIGGLIPSNITKKNVIILLLIRIFASIYLVNIHNPNQPFKDIKDRKRIDHEAEPVLNDSSHGTCV